MRQFTEDRELTAWLVLDRSASMALRRARAAARTTCWPSSRSCLARLFGRGGNRVGAMLYDGGTARVVPPGTGRDHALRIGHELDAQRRALAAARHHRLRRDARRRPRAGPAPVAGLRGLRLHRHRRLGRPLLRLAHRHEVVALRVVDAADDELPEVGLIVVEDAETGEQLLVDSSDPLFRPGSGPGSTSATPSLTGRMRRAGVPLHRIGTDHDLVEALVEVVAEHPAGGAR